MSLSTRTATAASRSRQPVKKVVKQPARRPTSEDEAEVSAVQYLYRVDYGRECEPRYHYVDKQRKCRCGDPKCPAVGAVRDYLAKGGERAMDYPDDYWAEVPAKCPACGARCERHANLDFHAHGVGWKCEKGGTEHYWQARTQVLLKTRKANPGVRWVIPPAGDYPGVTVDDARIAREKALKEIVNA